MTNAKTHVQIEFEKSFTKKKHIVPRYTLYSGQRTLQQQFLEGSAVTVDIFMVYSKGISLQMAQLTTKPHPIFVCQEIGIFIKYFFFISTCDIILFKAL